MDQISNQIAWFDLETTRGGQLCALAAVMGTRRPLLLQDLRSASARRQAVKQLGDYIQEAEFVAGHNILDHDLPFLEQIAPDHPIHVKAALDSLVFSAIAFPQKPYHGLVKGYKLVHDSISNPLRDVELAQQVFKQSVSAIRDIHAEHRGLLSSLFSLDSRFEPTARFIRQLIPTPDIHDITGCFYDLFKEQACAPGIRQFVESEEPSVEWAFLSVWLRVAGDGSAIPAWVNHEWPKLRKVCGQLRGVPCAEACVYCREHLKPEKWLPRFGIDTGFRSKPQTPEGNSLQGQIAQDVISGESVLAILPTGGGKSVCYQLPALARYEATGELTVVISPLQSLMKDQADGLEERLGGRLAEVVSGMLSPVEREIALDRVARGEAALLYISPEQLRNPSIDSLLKTREVNCWVFDEAHCVSKWGHDFRPDYLSVAGYIAEYAKHSARKKPQVCAFTATAKPDVIAEITEHLKTELDLELILHNGGSERSNLSYEIRHVIENEKPAELESLLRQHLSGGGAAVVFASTRKRVVKFAEFLREHGFNAEAYHAGLDNDAKKDIQNRYLAGEIDIICATNAFGMGVDKPDIRLVVHMDVPGSLENYLQEAGRAGRDRDPAHCALLFTTLDLERQFSLGTLNALTKADLQHVLRALRRLEKRFKTDQNSVLYCTEKEIAIEEPYLDDDARSNKIKTAVAWLERRGFLERRLNRNSVWTGQPVVPSMHEAGQIIEKLSLNPKARDNWYAIMRQLMKEGDGVPVSSDELLAVIYNFEDDRPPEPGYLMRLLRQMQHAGLLKQEAAYTVFADFGVKHDSLWRLSLIHEAEATFLRWLQEQEPDAPLEEPLRLDLSKAVGHVRSELAQNPSIGKQAAQLVNNEVMRGLLEVIQRDGLGWGKRGHSFQKRNIGRDQFAIQLNEYLPTIQQMSEHRRRLMQGIVEHVIGVIKQAGSRGKNLKHEISLATLIETLRKDMFLQQHVQDEDQAVEACMYAMHRLHLLEVRGGRTVIRQAMGVYLKPEAQKRRVTNADMADLETHHHEQRLQIHTIGVFAELANTQKLAAAMTFALDYFRLSKDEFMERYKDYFGDEIERPTTQASYDEIVTKLNDSEQESIVTAKPDLNRLVLAGPGSGKTNTLVHRVGWLVRVQRVAPAAILVVTFNRLAAQLVRERLRQLLGPEEGVLVRVYTYHALALNLLDLSAEAQAATNTKDEIDWDDLIRLATRVLSGDEGLLGVDPADAHDRLLGRITHVLVDEYQDIDQDKYDFLSAITNRAKVDADRYLNLFAVGDDDQNIYAWNGTSTEFIRRFEEDYQAERSVLTRNYRSTPSIIQSSQQLIQHNRDRMKDGVTLVPAGHGHHDRDQPIRIVKVNVGQAAEVRAILDQMQAWSKEGVKWESMAVLGRTKHILHQLRYCCEQEGIPVRLRLPSALGRLIRVRECAELDRTLERHGSAFLVLDAVRDMIRELRPDRRERLNRWQTLLGRAANAVWKVYDPDQPLPASQVRSGINELLIEAGREFTIGRGAYLSTAHSAKGLEFDRVLIPATGWDLKRSTDLESERRLFYVAMTRARHAVTVTDNGSHLFAGEYEATHTQMNGVAASPDRELPRVEYGLLGLNEIYMGYPALFGPNHPIHNRLRRCGEGTRVELASRNNRVVVEYGGGEIARLSEAASKAWLHKLPFVMTATVYALIERDAEQDFQKTPQVDRWELPLIEIITRV